MAIKKTGSATYSSLGKTGKGQISTQSGALSNHPYGFNTRFEDSSGTNPEELIAAAHASCFTMALSFALADAGYTQGELATTASVCLEQEGEGFTVTESALTLTAAIPGIKETEFNQISNQAMEHCPISKLLNAELSLSATLN